MSSNKVHRPSPLIEASGLLNIYQNKNVKIVDASNDKNARILYQENHLLGAVHIDLETQLSAKEKDPKRGGRHPLPTPGVFAETLSDLGITNDDQVIIYDRKSGSNAAARLWWMMTAYGHKDVQVLNGGFQAANELGFPLESGTHQLNKALYKTSKWQHQTVDINEVESASKNNDFVIVDVRDPRRFQGIYEPIDLVAGHIPNAINLPFVDNLDANGHFKSSDQLKVKFKSIIDSYDIDKIIFHCGSGVTACHSLLAITSAGFKMPKLYVGSWSEWSRNNKPIETIKK